VANTDTINSFIAVFTAVLTADQKAQALVDLFCPNGADAWGNPIPSVGITDHGPHFVGKQIPHMPILPKTIDVLFGQLFKSFPNISLAPASVPQPPQNYPPFLSSANYAPPTIAYQTNLITGPYKARWFSPTDPNNYSPPMSNAPPNASASVTVPACCIFTFNGAYQIVQLAVYMDRYRLWAGLQPGGQAMVAALGHATAEAIHDFEKERKK
jgi:hypothetical protein